VLRSKHRERGSYAVDVMVAVGPNLFYTVTSEETEVGNLLEEFKFAA
jgi:hypothetical protein